MEFLVYRFLRLTVSAAIPIMVAAAAIVAVAIMSSVWKVAG